MPHYILLDLVDIRKILKYIGYIKKYFFTSEILFQKDKKKFDLHVILRIVFYLQRGFLKSVIELIRFQ